MIKPIINKTQEPDLKILSKEKKKVLEMRAHLLRESPVKNEIITGETSGIEFLLGDEHYFVESDYVGEVAHLKEITPLPGTAAFIMGIFNLRGKILAVINLKSFFNLPEKAITNHNRIITLKYHETEFGILADEIAGFTKIFKTQLQLNIAGITKNQSGFIMGITKENLIVLDMKEIFTDKRMIIN